MVNFLLFITLACFWGGSFVAIKHVVGVFPPVFGAMLRVLLALIFLEATSRIFNRQKWPPTKELRWKFWLAGILSQGLPFSLLFWGGQYIAPGLAGIFNGTVPIWTLLLGWAFMHKAEPPTFWKVAGVSCGLLGILLIFWPKIMGQGDAAAASLLSAQADNHARLMGTLAVLVMAISYAIGGLMNRALISGPLKVDTNVPNYQQSFISVFYLLALSLLTEGVPKAEYFTGHWTVWAAIIYMGWVSTGLAFMIYFKLLKEWGALRSSSVTYVVPVIALKLDYLIYGNLPDFGEIVGTIAILAGVVMIQVAPILQGMAVSRIKAIRRKSVAN